LEHGRNAGRGGGLNEKQGDSVREGEWMAGGWEAGEKQGRAATANVAGLRGDEQRLAPPGEMH